MKIFKKNEKVLNTEREREELKEEAKKVRLDEKLGKKVFHQDVKELYEPITQTIKDTTEEIYKENESTTKATGGMIKNHSYTLYKKMLKLKPRKEKTRRLLL